MTIFKKLFFKYTIPTLVLASTFTANAENIYQTGSEGDLLYNNIKYLLPPEVVPLFIPAEDPTRILKKHDHYAYAKSGISAETIDYIVSRLRKKFTAEKGIRAYVIYGKNMPGNEIGKKMFCGIVFTSLASQKDEGILIHEAIHCKNSFVNGSDAYMKAANPALQLRKKLTTRQFMAMLEEASTAGLQVAYAYNLGKMAALPIVEYFARFNFNTGGSIGYRTARGLLKLCGRKDACPMDTIGMVNTIVQNKKLLNDLMTDMFEIQAIGEKTGFVLAEQ